MSKRRKPNVRPPIANFDKRVYVNGELVRPQAAPPAPPAPLPQMPPPFPDETHINERAEEMLKGLAAELFEEKRRLEVTLKIYDQDTERAFRNDAPEKFRWRVRPSEMMRTHKLLRELREEIAEMRQTCISVVTKLVEREHHQKLRAFFKSTPPMDEEEAKALETLDKWEAVAPIAEAMERLEAYEKGAAQPDNAQPPESPTSDEAA